MPTAKKKPVASPTPPGDIQAEIAYQLLAACRKHLKGNNLRKNFHKLWYDTEKVRPGRPEVAGNLERVLWEGVQVGRRSLHVQVFVDAVFLNFREDGKGFDLQKETFERDIAEFIASHFQCYFPTYWMTGGDK
jgi:hypothetical protein